MPHCKKYRRRHTSAGRLEVLHIPHTHNLKIAGAVGTRVDITHSIRLEHFKLALLGVSEVRWNGAGSITFYSGMPGENMRSGNTYKQNHKLCTPGVETCI
jgi:hypothetical protein